MKSDAPANVTWKWIGGTAITIVILGGSGWLTYMQNQVGATYVAIDKTKERIAEQAVDQAVTKQKVQDIDRNVNEVKKDVGEIKSILQQIQINQQQQIRDAPPRR